jgi:hypothetical protein
MEREPTHVSLRWSEKKSWGGARAINISPLMGRKKQVLLRFQVESTKYKSSSSSTKLKYKVKAQSSKYKVQSTKFKVQSSKHSKHYHPCSILLQTFPF